MKNRGVVSVIGRDQKGIVARISTYLAAHDINIEHIEQRVVEGLFIMSMRVDLTEVSTTLDEVIVGLKAIGAEIGVEITLRLTGGGERKRFAILVTKERHCLDALVRDHRGGKLAGDPVVVLSNHELLRGVADEAGIPFFARGAEDMAAHGRVPHGEDPRIPRRSRGPRALHAHPLARVRRQVSQPRPQHPSLPTAVLPWRQRI
jgi:formyltetrahydrofolate deformylase